MENQKIEEAVKRASWAETVKIGGVSPANPASIDAMAFAWLPVNPDPIAGVSGSVSGWDWPNQHGTLTLQTRRVKVYAAQLASGREYDALSTYLDGPFYCVAFMEHFERRVHKYPVESISMIEEPGL